MYHVAGMAQSVEHVIGNDEVISSILITSSKTNKHGQSPCLFVLAPTLHEEELLNYQNTTTVKPRT